MQAKSKRSVIILGCTGSIGTTALQALATVSDLFEVVALSAHSATSKLAQVAQQWNCKRVCISNEANHDQTLFGDGTLVYKGSQGLITMIKDTEADIVLNAISGSSGLAPTLAALESHKDVALSNKESIVMAGEFLFSYARSKGVHIIPVDSEHATLHALLQAFGVDQIESLVITASGGPFRTLPASKMVDITVEMALAHPTWEMGAKISIDSATLANKGLEVIEAAYLFEFPPTNIEVVIHPQSIVHSLIRMHHGALYAQLSPPDMTLPIMAALADQTIPLQAVVEPLDFSHLTLTFEQPDLEKFPLLKHAFACIALRGGYPIAYNGANEFAVEQFLAGNLSFLQIAQLVEEVLAHDWSTPYHTITDVFSIDSHVRHLAQQVFKRLM